MAYPTALQCSGPISMGQVRDWMIAAGELSPITDTVSLETLVLASHLSDKIRPHNLSQFYCYAIDVMDCGDNFSVNGTTYQQTRDVDVGTSSGNVVIAFTAYNNNGSGNQLVSVEVQYQGGSWILVKSVTVGGTGGYTNDFGNYTFTYAGSNIIKVRVTKANS